MKVEIAFSQNGKTHSLTSAPSLDNADVTANACAVVHLKELTSPSPLPLSYRKVSNAPPKAGERRVTRQTDDYMCGRENGKPRNEKRLPKTTAQVVETSVIVNNRPFSGLQSPERSNYALR